jgi:hypothetical protein
MGVGNIMFQDKAARTVRDDPAMKNFTPNGIRRLLHEFVKVHKHLLDEHENTEQYREEHPFWYRAVVPVPDFPHGLFVKVLLVDEDEDEPFVENVSAHPQLS